MKSTFFTIIVCIAILAAIIMAIGGYFGMISLSKKSEAKANLYFCIATIILSLDVFLFGLYAGIFSPKPLDEIYVKIIFTFFMPGIFVLGLGFLFFRRYQKQIKVLLDEKPKVIIKEKLPSFSRN